MPQPNNKNHHLSKKHLEKASTKTNSFRAIDKYRYTQFDNPIKHGKYYFTYGYYNDVGEPALFYQTKLTYDSEILVDPNYISKKDRIKLRGYSLSGDSKYLAYQFSRNGSDQAEIMIMSMEHKENLNDHLKGIKFSGMSWKDDGFYYSVVAQDGQFGEIKGQKIYYHKVGTDQSEDQLVFQRKNNPTAHFYAKTTKDEQFFILTENNERDNKKNMFYIDFRSGSNALKPLFINYHFGLSIIDSKNGKLIASTTNNAKNGAIVEIDPKNPLQWRTIANEFTNAVLLDVIPFKDRIVATYQSNQHPIIMVYNYDGVVLYTLERPVATSVHGFYGNPEDEEVLFRFTSYTVPTVVYKFNLKTFKRTLHKRTSVTFDIKKIVYTELEYKSNDDTIVPMILVHSKEMELDGSNPLILEAYGGFGAIAQPSFDPGIVHFVKSGGIYAFANVRGGGDYGRDWEFAGKGENKQQSFDDFIAAAEFLIDQKYTNKNKLAITGGSNGGLVVAAAATQRPELFKAVVPVVAPLDMIRFENFTVGQWHRDEYGTVSDSLGFLNLLSYSPYHNIDENINYPSTLVITSDNDDRVPPFHSYKFVKKLQDREVQKNPILLKVEENSGHYGASTLYSTIKESANIVGFILNELNE